MLKLNHFFQIKIYLFLASFLLFCHLFFKLFAKNGSRRLYFFIISILCELLSDLKKFSNRFNSYFRFRPIISLIILEKKKRKKNIIFI